MMKQLGFKIATSTLVLGLTMVGCSPLSRTSSPAIASANAPASGEQAAALFARAHADAAKQEYASALTYAEQAVQASPRDVAYRMVLADLYLKNGRFASAEAAFKDVLTLNPDNQRASLSLALTQIANGRGAAAVGTLDGIAYPHAPGDVGLAYALAGQPERAVAMIEPVARAEGATARVRQNLALSYALAGDWERARVTAAQDVSPAELPARMEQWAALASSGATNLRVANLLGVTPVPDGGMPIHLALSSEAPAGYAFASAAAVPVEAVEPAQATSFADAAPATLRTEAPAEVHYAAAVQSLVVAQPAVAAPIAEAPVPTFQPRAKSVSASGKLGSASRSTKQGRYVVQIGAFSTASATERAWQVAERRYGFISEREPLTTTISIPGRGEFHRLAISGFDQRGDAAAVCASIKAKGGACFVRVNAGDAPVRWASRSARNV
jgi:Flp pilus assembly protein TadD